jgi:hypothetical protein
MGGHSQHHGLDLLVYCRSLSEVGFGGRRNCAEKEHLSRKET